MQIFWVKQAYSLREGQFRHRVDVALNDVADKIMSYSGDTTLLIDPVSQRTTNHFLVELNEPVSLPILEALLIASFKEHKVETDVEFGVYDCIVDSMYTGRYLRYDTTFTSRPNRVSSLPVVRSDQSYFSVYFPKKDAYFFNEMSFWVFSSGIIFIIISFFAYTTFIILRQRKMSEATREFINNMTHEFKTPISTIGVSSEVLLRDPAVQQSDRLRTYAGIIGTENLRLKKQVDRVLQLASLEKDDLQLNLEEVDVHELIRQAVETQRASLDKKEGELHTHLLAQQPHILADKVHITNILYNLLDNAIKYSGEQSPDITVSTEIVREGFRISVQDKGIGISKEDRKHIFKKFYRVSTGNRHDVKGFGLGLSYVKMMVDAHRGSIHVDSEPGIGSTFVITLPYP